MDTIYGNKKYIQNLNAMDYYGRTSARTANECASYHNTMSRQSFFGNYPCTKYKYSYPSDVSLSTYGYTSWGLWRETGHLSPSMYSKKRINIRSFSILIMAAAFIVLLAILSVAAFAFYFSSLKSDVSESILVFDCSLRVSKGDIWTSQLKQNHTTAFRQKSTFYKKFIETSLEHGNFNVARTEIYSFGEGPTMVPSFRIYLDMRKIQMTITNVEELIKNAFMSETLASDSAFKNLKIHPDSIEIKRQLDPEILQQAAFIHEQSMNANALPTATIMPGGDESSQYTPKKTSSTFNEKSKVKSSSTSAATMVPKASSSGGGKKKENAKFNYESEIDTDNLPVIQGSFEITKTDADISQKKTNTRHSSTASLGISTSTLKPFYLSPVSSIRVKSNDSPAPTTTTRQTTMSPRIESATQDKVLEMFWQHHLLLNQTEKSIITTTTTPSTTTESFIESTSDVIGSTVNNELPKLDSNLFTSAPVLDKEPWHPINPHNPTAAPPPLLSPSLSSNKVSVPSSSSSSSMPPKPTEENVMYRNKVSEPILSLADNDDNDSSVLYQSFHNTDFSGASLEIEKLGMADVKPYPLPVNKINLSDETDASGVNVRPLESELEQDFKAHYDGDKFEYLGGGVIAKKPEVIESSTELMNVNFTSSTNSSSSVGVGEKEEEEQVTSTEVDASSTAESEVAISTDEMQTTTEKLNFMNMKNFIAAQMQNKTSNTTSLSDKKPISVINTSTSEPQLFPSISKWEFVNGTRTSGELNVTKKVFNETLQAVIVENIQTSSVSPRIVDDVTVNQTGGTNKANLQQISTIFDTLASKLGLKTDVASKVPPFSQQTHNKIKQNSDRRKTSTENVSPTTPLSVTSTTTQQFTAAETLLGQAEVEAVDPTKYEEILSMASSPFAFSSTVPSLVTLLPPKSNSAIRRFKPPREQLIGGTRNMETVVKTSMTFDA